MEWNTSLAYLLYRAWFRFYYFFVSLCRRCLFFSGLTPLVVPPLCCVRPCCVIFQSCLVFFRFTSFVSFRLLLCCFGSFSFRMMCAFTLFLDQFVRFKVRFFPVVHNLGNRYPYPQGVWDLVVQFLYGTFPTQKTLLHGADRTRPNRQHELDDTKSGIQCRSAFQRFSRSL